MAGYTLMELLVTLAIVGIVAVMATPNMITMMERNQKSSALNNVLGMLSIGRSEAVTRQLTVSACASTDQATCDTNNWEAGWLLFVDDGSGTGGVADDGNLNGTEEILRIGGAASGDVTIRLLADIADQGAISFDDEGLAVDPGTIVVCIDGDVDSASAAILNVSGQPRLAVDTGADGIVEDSTGNTNADNVTCD